MRQEAKTKIGIACTDDLAKVGSSKYLLDSALQLGNLTEPSFLFAFTTTNVDSHMFFNDLRRAVGPDIPVLGGSAIGVISNNFLSYKKNSAGVLAVQSDIMDVKVECEKNLNLDEEAAGSRLIEKFGQKFDSRIKLLMILYDTIKLPPQGDSPPFMNSSAYLLKGVHKTLQKDIPICGAGLLGDYNFCPTYQFCGDHLGQEHAVGILFCGKITVNYRIMHGCTPIDGIYRKITKIEGPVLYEIDGKPVVELINELLGDEDWQRENPVDFLTLGVNYGERYGTYDEEAYVNRLIMGVTPDKKGVLLFEPDLEEGMEIQLMTRDTERMIESARKNTSLLLKSIINNGERPLFAIYIDCAGRAAGYLKTDTEEAWEVQKLFNEHKIPLFGFYSGVEIAPLLGTSRGLDWTGLLIVFAEKL